MFYCGVLFTGKNKLMNINENGTNFFSLEEFEDVFGTKISGVDEKSIVKVSTECVQDVLVHRKQLFSLRSKGDITKEEIEDYSKFNQQLSSFDFDESRKKVTFVYRDTVVEIY